VPGVSKTGGYGNLRRFRDRVVTGHVSTDRYRRRLTCTQKQRLGSDGSGY
jgi:hypothetical protein